MKKRILKIVFNWYSTPENGEVYSVRKLFESYDGNQVLDIKEHLPQGEGDRLYYDVSYHRNKKEERIFNPNIVEWDYV